MVELRELTEKDLKYFVEIRKYSVEFLHNKEVYNLVECKQWFKEQKDLYLMATIDDILVGYIRTSNKQENSVYIGMDIHPDYRGRGYASRIYPVAIDTVKEKLGVEKIQLEVLSYNKRGIHIYTKLGFVEYDRQPYNDNGDFSIKMELV